MKQIENKTDFQGYLPPQAPELEKAIIGAILLETEAIDFVSTILSGDDFYLEAHKTLFTECQSLRIKGLPTDFASVGQSLKDANKLDDIGGYYFLVNLTKDVTSTANVEAHCRIIKQKSMGRQLIKMAGEIITRSYQNEDVFDVCNDSMSHLLAITQDTNKNNIQTIGQAMKEAVAENNLNRENKVEFIGTPTGFKELDELTGGLGNSNLIVIAADTSEGKSILAINIAENVAKSGIPVLMFNLEMKNKENGNRVLSRNLQESVKNIRRGKIGEQKAMKMNEIAISGSDIPLFMLDNGSISITEIRNVARSMVANKRIGLIVIDYLQLVKADAPGRKTGFREQDVAFIASECKAMAMELGVPVIALSQLSRRDKGSERAYRIDDLRESGAIGQCANDIWFIYRAHLKSLGRKLTSMSTPDLGDFNTDENDALLIVAKGRETGTGTLRLKCDLANSRFLDYGEWFNGFGQEQTMDISHTEVPNSGGSGVSSSNTQLSVNMPTNSIPPILGGSYDSDLPF